MAETDIIEGTIEESDISTIKCTNFCGFSVTGESRYAHDLYEDHEHQEHPGTFEPGHWYDAVFSLWGAVIFSTFASLIVLLTVEIFKK